MEIKENASIVIVGEWNVGILKPLWFAKEFPQLEIKDEVPVELEMSTGAFRFQVQKIKINPNPNKLIFFSDVDENKNYDLMSEIAIETVNKLQHTPVVAIGHNISFFTDDTFRLFENDALDNYEEFYKSKANCIALNAQEIKHSLAYENYTLNLTYNINRQKHFVMFNYNYSTSNIKKTVEFLESFKTNITDSKTIFSKLVK
jgi:hypothetical protein